MTTTTHPDHDRVMAAYDALSDLAKDTSPRPWEPFEEHGRDFTDEGWSHIGVRNAAGEVACTEPLSNVGTMDPDPRADAHLIAAAVNGWEAALTLARLVAERHRPITRAPYASRCLACRTFAPCEEYLAAIAVLDVTLTLDARCCDLHGRNCETPSELCCENCTEVNHPHHNDGSVCSNPDLSAPYKPYLGGGTMHVPKDTLL